MAVNYKIYQSKAENSSKNLYYARASYGEMVDLRTLAERMQANCTVKRADIMAVLCELVDAMKLELQNSNKVRIDGLGIFKVGLKSKGANTAKEFKPQSQIVGARILFTPEARRNSSGKLTRDMLADMKYTELTEYKSVKSAAAVEE